MMSGNVYVCFVTEGAWCIHTVLDRDVAEFPIHDLTSAISLLLLLNYGIKKLLYVHRIINQQKHKNVYKSYKIVISGSMVFKMGGRMR